MSLPRDPPGMPPPSWLKEMAAVQQQIETTPTTERLTCATCYGETTEGPRCNGDPSHSFCPECFNTFARRIAFEAEGEYEREIPSANGIVSQCGQLPCPLFRGGQCHCHDIGRTTMAQNLDEENLLRWTRAERRIAIAVEERERQLAAQALEEAQTRQSDLEILFDSVIQALALGASVACPQCGTRGLKDDACMHIRCQTCNCRWCYCCGRPRGNGRGNCSSCDSPAIMLENHPGWNNYAIRGESRGYGALYEFQRKRMAFFLRTLKECGVTLALWQQLFHEHPELLVDIPTLGRSIQQGEIDSASPPLFGRTRETDLRWRNDAQPIIDDLLHRLANNSQPAAQRQAEERTELEVLIDDILTQGDGAAADALLREIFGDDPRPAPRRRRGWFRRR